eukprot:scaffold524_cov82-Cylindrotheca_fusiformis.AAC.1
MDSRATEVDAEKRRVLLSSGNYHLSLQLGRLSDVDYAHSRSLRTILNDRLQLKSVIAEAVEGFTVYG